MKGSPEPRRSGLGGPLRCQNRAGEHIWPGSRTAIRPLSHRVNIWPPPGPATTGTGRRSGRRGPLEEQARVLPDPVELDHPVEVRAGRVPREAFVANDLTGAHVLP